MTPHHDLFQFCCCSFNHSLVVYKFPVLFLYLNSAGVGRTGTYIAFDVVDLQIEKTKSLDVQKAVLDMRKNRKNMVQTVVIHHISCFYELALILAYAVVLM